MVDIPIAGCWKIAHLWMIMMIYGRHNGCIIIGGVYMIMMYIMDL